ncbi:MAG: hypothetical protein SGI73_12270 [Chloroflexota bacterium]|nr:hypothetical protein [Chloroflexota bacterium]
MNTGLLTVIALGAFLALSIGGVLWIYTQDDLILIATRAEAEAILSGGAAGIDTTAGYAEATR